MDDLLPISKLAEKYPVSKSLLYSACQSGMVPHYRVPSKDGKRGKYLIREGDFLAWLERHRIENTVPMPPHTHVTL